MKQFITNVKVSVYQPTGILSKHCLNVSFENLRFSSHCANNEPFVEDNFDLFILNRFSKHFVFNSFQTYLHITHSYPLVLIRSDTAQFGKLNETLACILLSICPKATHFKEY